VIEIASQGTQAVRDLVEMAAMLEAPPSSHVQLIRPMLDPVELSLDSPAIVDTGEEAVRIATAAQREWAHLSVENRRKIIAHVRAEFEVHAVKLAEAACRETGLGRVEDKIAKNLLAINKTPGPEFLEPDADATSTDPWMVHTVPYGVICAVTPVTNPAATVINNGLSMLSAGNTVVFQSHPGALDCSSAAVAIMHQAIVNAGGPAGCVTMHAQSGRDAAARLITHPDIDVVVVTGGPKLVRTAIASGKRVIAGGPANPPALVDASADLGAAAESLIRGAGFDNNILCIGEKEVVAVASIGDELVLEMVRRGAYLLRGAELDRATELLVEQSEGQRKPSRRFIGQSPATLLNALHIPFDRAPRLLICETVEAHPFAQLEMLMPLLPVVRADNFTEALAMARRLEHGNHHSSVIHSNDWDHIKRMGQSMQTTVLVANAPSYSAIGHGAPGHTSFTIATPTGEGVTSCRTFVRQCRMLARGSRLPS
jgi:propionaldehyde dehydrogenase